MVDHPSGLMMKRLLAVLAVLAAVLVLTACNPPSMIGGGWIWDSTPSHPIRVDPTTNPGFDINSATAVINAAAHETVFGVGGGADVDFAPMTPICPLGNCNDRRVMWTYAHRSGPYVDHCTVFYDPTMYWGNAAIWNYQTLAHEWMHCLDYPDTTGAGGYTGVLSYDNFWDPWWRAKYWWGADDRAMLARDGYGP